MNRFRPRHWTRTSDGFTLAELMVVVIIVGILMAVAIPIFNKQRRLADLTKVRTYAHQLGTNLDAALADDRLDNVGTSQTNIHIVRDTSGRAQIYMTLAPDSGWDWNANDITNANLRQTLTDAGVFLPNGDWYFLSKPGDVENLQATIIVDQGFLTGRPYVSVTVTDQQAVHTVEQAWATKITEQGGWQDGDFLNYVYDLCDVTDRPFAIYRSDLGGLTDSGSTINQSGNGWCP
jgi:type IV pilus assembly protein PilA